MLTQSKTADEVPSAKVTLEWTTENVRVTHHLDDVCMSSAEMYFVSFGKCKTNRWSFSGPSGWGGPSRVVWLQMEYCCNEAYFALPSMCIFMRSVRRFLWSNESFRMKRGIIIFLFFCENAFRKKASHLLIKLFVCVIFFRYLLISWISCWFVKMYICICEWVL